jgi:hypothetical protein
MCEGSIYVKHRQATDKERLVVRNIPGYSFNGYYPYESAGDSRLVCVRHTTEAIMKEVRFEPGLPPALDKWAGQRNVKVYLRHRSYQDMVSFPDGMVVNLTALLPGVRLDIGYPVEYEPGMKVVEGALREALALPPDPKPEGEDAADAPSSEPPAEQQNPEKEPAEAPPTAARR